MRLQLIAASVAIAAATGPAAAEPPAPARAWGALRLYLDDDHVTVVSPSASATAPLGEDGAITADTTADAISSASIDVLSAASPVAVRELRLEAGALLEHAIGTTVVRTDFRVSHEADYLALRGGAGLRAELLSRTLTLDVRYQAGSDRAESAIDETFRGRRTTHEVSAVAGRVLDAHTVVDLAVDLQRASGYHASPYRRVPIVDPSWPLPTWVDEQTPRLRRGAALTARARRAFGDAWFVAAGHRVYADDWSMTSHTTTLELRHQLDDAWLLAAGLRGYLQSGASFYRRVYTAEIPDARTRDRTLGPMRTLFGSVTADRALGDGDAHLVLGCGVLAMWFLDSALQAERRALMTTASVTYDF